MSGLRKLSLIAVNNYVFGLNIPLALHIIFRSGGELSADVPCQCRSLRIHVGGLLAWQETVLDNPDGRPLPPSWPLLLLSLTSDGSGSRHYRDHYRNVVYASPHLKSRFYGVAVLCRYISFNPRVVSVGLAGALPR